MIKSLLLFIGILFSLPICAQNTYTEKIRKNEPGKGSVIINHSSEIEQVVNGTAPKTNKDASNKKPTAPSKPANTTTPAKKEEHSATNTHNTPNASSEHSKKPSETREESKKATTTSNHSYTSRVRKRAKGYRICIFTGGNSRADKVKATQMGDKCRKLFPELAVYPSFEAPRWVTHVGDFRTREEAQKYVTRIRKARISYEVRIVSSNVNIPYWF